MSMGIVKRAALPDGAIPVADGMAWRCGACGVMYDKRLDALHCCAEVIEATGPSEKYDNPNATQVGGDHYKRMAVQPWDVVDTWPLAERIAYYRGNALKYLMRLNDKDTPEQNARKAEHYCQKLAETLGGK